MSFLMNDGWSQTKREYMSIPRCHSLYEDLLSCSDRVRTPTRVYKGLWCLRNRGWVWTVRAVWSRMGGLVGIRGKRPGRIGPADTTTRQDVLNLEPGEWVEVRSESDIRERLDAQGRTQGLLWMSNMSRFCGKRYRVYKRVERMMLESNGEIRKIKNTVLLEGAICEDLYGCDRSCYHFWKEAWLKRWSDIR